ncbi:MAG TPA: XdhC family protein [Steroidobacteraceae bacterium]|nr:XdhC family protein [Steroidobacteraceae bacterium]
MDPELLEVASSLNRERAAYALATVMETQGSASAKPSSKALIDAQGRLLTGWVGGGCAESAVCKAALECLETGEATIVDIDLSDEVLGAGMPCGGRMRVFVDPVLPRPQLWLMGHGRIAEALCTLADLLGFDVIVDDGGATWQRYVAAKRLITDDLDYSQLAPLPNDSVVIASQHKGDHESIERALASEARYIALIASRKRSGLVLRYLRERGVDRDNLARVVAPAGLDLGGRTPEEIALSVVSQMVMVRRGGSGVDKRKTTSSSANEDLNRAHLRSA